MSRALVWSLDGRDWPNRESSRFVLAGGVRWHVQIMGKGPIVLLIHGAASSSHTWRDLAPMLAREFTVVAPDLPGHAFSSSPASKQHTITATAAAMGALLEAVELPPRVVAGHSAGAAAAVRLILDGHAAPQSLVCMNGALLPPAGLPGQFFSPTARLLSGNPLLASLFARRAVRPGFVEGLLARTGSVLDEQGVALYRRLAGNATHVRAVLAMMAHWDLRRLSRELTRVQCAVRLLHGERDGMIPQAQFRHLERTWPDAGSVVLGGLGHLAHEEAPGRVTAEIRQAAVAAGVLRKRQADACPPG